jgi:hypothetical protein
MPTPTKYTYNQDVSDLDLLTTEIAASSIVQTADRIDRLSGSPDTVDVWFPDVLIAADQTTLNTVMTDHDLLEAKATKRKAINDYRDYRLYVLKYNWPTDISATLGFINAGNTLPVGFTWRDADNVDQTFTDQQFKDFGKDAWNRAENMHDIAKQHKDAVDALTTVAAVESYDYTTETPSWPA